MFYYSPKSIRIIATIVFLLCGSSFLFAQESSSKSSGNSNDPEGRESAIASFLVLPKEKKLSELEKLARLYRSQGLDFQHIGNLDAAMALYQKAIELDPVYAVAYNDLGIIYEAKDLTDRAEEAYQMAIKIDPYFLSAYSNLAILYENKRDLNKAAFYWGKRVEIASADDPWKEKARERLADIHALLLPPSLKESREQEIIGLVNDLSQRPKTKPKAKTKLTPSQELFKKAKESYAKQDYAAAFKEALDAQQLDPTNKEIAKFIDRVEADALSK